MSWDNYVRYPSKVRLSSAERQRNYRNKNRAKHGGRNLNYTMRADIAACVLYLQAQWGFKTYREAFEAALRFTTLCTRFGGLKTLPQTIDDLDLPDVSQ